MIKVLKHILSAVSFFAVLLIILSVISPLFEPKNNTEEDGIILPQASSVFGEPDDTLEVLFLGNSEAMCGISPMEFWRAHGVPTHVCASGNQQMFTCMDFLKQTADRHQLKVVVLETNTIYYDSPKTDELTDFAERIFPILRYHNRWKKLSARDLSAKNYLHTDISKGAFFTTDSVPAVPVDYMAPTKDIWEFPAVGERYTRQMAQFCAQRDIAFVLVSVPSCVNWHMSQHNAVAALADELDIPFLDMNLLTDEIGIDWSTDSKDGGDHMNYLGADKVTKYLGQWLVDHYGLTDHRQDYAWAAWSDALAAYDAYRREKISAQ